jgi:hypothetical protein
VITSKGDEVAESYVHSMLKIDGFKTVGYGFKYTIPKNLDEYRNFPDYMYRLKTRIPT